MSFRKRPSFRNAFFRDCLMRCQLDLLPQSIFDIASLWNESSSSLALTKSRTSLAKTFSAELRKMASVKSSTLVLLLCRSKSFPERPGIVKKPRSAQFRGIKVWAFWIWTRFRFGHWLFQLRWEIALSWCMFRYQGSFQREIHGIADIAGKKPVVEQFSVLLLILVECNPLEFWTLSFSRYAHILRNVLRLPSSQSHYEKSLPCCRLIWEGYRQHQ